MGVCVYVTVCVIVCKTVIVCLCVRIKPLNAPSIENSGQSWLDSTVNELIFAITASPSSNTSSVARLAIKHIYIYNIKIQVYII